MLYGRKKVYQDDVWWWSRTWLTLCQDAGEEDIVGLEDQGGQKKLDLEHGGKDPKKDLVEDPEDCHDEEVQG